MQRTIDLENFIRDVPDFPKPGIVFKDMMPILQHPDRYAQLLEELTAAARQYQPDVIVGAEARGFIVGAPLALNLECGFVPARKPGKLPYTTIAAKYALEYGFDSLEIHMDAIEEGQRVLICDDVLATGGTAAAQIELVEKLGGEVTGCLFVMELAFLEGRKKIEGYPTTSLLSYED